MRRKNQFITSPQHASTESTEALVTVILLCENAGHRMKSYGPTPLAQIGNTTLLDLQISSISRVFRNFELIICGGFEAEKVIKHIRDKYKSIPARFVENQVHKNTNSCESLRLALNNTLNDKILICNGEIILQDALLKSIDIRKSFVVYDNNNPNFEVGITIDQKGWPQNFCYGIGNKWAEILFLSNSIIIEQLRKLVSNIEYKNKFVFEALNEIIKTKHRLSVIENIGDKILKLDNIKTYHEVRKTYARTNTRLLKS